MSDSSQPAELPWYIAQLVEQPPCKLKVMGLNPTQGSKSFSEKGAVLGELSCVVSIKSFRSLIYTSNILYMHVYRLSGRPKKGKKTKKIHCGQGYVEQRLMHLLFTLSL